MQQYAIVLLAAILASTGPGQAEDWAPDALIRENCRKAEAIVEGAIVSSKTPPNSFTQTKFRVSRVYRRPFQVGEEFTYYSFRETEQRSASELTVNLIVFLAGRTRAHSKRWSTAIDFSEFPSSPRLASNVERCLRSKKP